MKRLTILFAAAIAVTALAQDIKVVSVGSVRRPTPTQAIKNLPDSLKVYDQDTKMYVGPTVYECFYSYVTNNESNSEPVKETTACVLQIGDGVSRFSDYTTYASDSVCHIVGIDDYSVMMAKEQANKNRFAYDEIIYQNMREGKMTVYGVIPPQCYVYDENRDGIEWEVIEGTDTICGYECMLAEGQYGGRTWRAWFTPELPIALGPWKFSGLPGLVLKAADADNVHSFEAIGFRKGVVPVYLPNWPDAVKIDRSKFIANKAKFESSPNPMKQIPPESIKEMAVMKGADGSSIFVINGVPLHKRENPYVARELE